MDKKSLLRIATGLTGLALAFGVGVVVGQNAPSVMSGVNVGPATSLDLGSEIDGVEGRQLRLRVVTFEPGGAIPLHSHKGRPAVAYVISGALTEHIEGVGTHVHRAGESWTEGKETNHWAENATDKPAVVVAVDVFKP